MIPLQIILEELSYLIQDSSSSRSLKNWCRRWDSLSLARRPAAMLLILVKRPLTASRLSFTCEVSKALLAIRLSAWPFRSFRRSCGQDTHVQTLGFSWVHQNVSKSLQSKSLMPLFSKIQLTCITICSNKLLPHGQKCQPLAVGVSSANYSLRPDLCHNPQRQAELPPKKQTHQT